MARELAKASPEATRAGLEYVKRSRGLNDVEAGKLASELRTRVMAGPDFKEGVGPSRKSATTLAHHAAQILRTG